MILPREPRDVTPAWLAAVTGGALPLEGMRSCSSEVIGVGFGLDGTVARIRLEGEAGIPDSVVGKWAKARQGAAEMRFYREAARALPLDLARFLGGEVAEEADRAVLLFEDLADARQGDMVEGAQVEEAVALAREAGRLHAAFWGRSLPLDLPPWEREPSRFAALVVEKRGRFLERWGERLSPALRSLVDRFAEGFLRAAEELRAHPATLIHDDLHLDNVMFRPDGRPVILDWPGARCGPGVVDFQRILGENLSVERRREGGGEVTEAYLEALREGGVRDFGEDRLERGVFLASVIVFAGHAQWLGRDDPREAEPRVGRILETALTRHGALVEDHPEWLEDLIRS